MFPDIPKQRNWNIVVCNRRIKRRVSLLRQLFYRSIQQRQFVEPIATTRIFVACGQCNSVCRGIYTRNNTGVTGRESASLEMRNGMVVCYSVANTTCCVTTIFGRDIEKRTLVQKYCAEENLGSSLGISVKKVSVDNSRNSNCSPRNMSLSRKKAIGCHNSQGTPTGPRK